VFRLKSPAFDNGREMDQKYGKMAQNVSPPLEWEGAPDGTRSSALAFVDIDPIARDYVHWLVADINPQLSSLPEGAAGSHRSGLSELNPYVGPSRRPGLTITNSRCTRSGPIGSAYGPVPRCGNSGGPRNGTRSPQPR
jgi:phosphatidylethanolamine-binding protein (PEBP) family uncharacterized protein